MFINVLMYQSTAHFMISPCLGVESTGEQRDLYKFLFTNYTKQLRPVRHHDNTINVTITYSIRSIQKLVSINLL